MISDEDLTRLSPAVRFCCVGDEAWWLLGEGTVSVSSSLQVAVSAEVEL